jgi:hypothetical protein
MRSRVVVGLAAFQTVDALVTTPPSSLLRADLERLGFPWRYRLVLPAIKASSAVGLLAGLRWPRLGRLTATALVVYFLFALGFHARARDSLLRYVPAAVILAWAAAARQAYPA